MPNLESTYYTIADILSFESDTNALKKTLTHPAMDWDQLVITGSAGLVIPAIYNRLKAKNLLADLPEDLVSYLKHITQLNAERNQQLYQEIRAISQLLNSHDIVYVFVKGAAMLAGNFYANPSERMIGDLDILVAKDQIAQAFELLQSVGYSKLIHFNYEVKNFRHYPRQMSEDKLGAIELHSDLLKYEHRHFIAIEDVLKQRQWVNQIAIPNNYYLNLHNILSWQINDYGTLYNFLPLKNSYDSLVLGLYKQEELIEAFLSLKPCAKYLAQTALLFKEYPKLDLNFNLRTKQQAFAFALKHRWYFKYHYKLKFYYINVKERLITFFTNNSYRKHILKHKLFKRS